MNYKDFCGSQELCTYMNKSRSSATDDERRRRRRHPPTHKSPQWEQRSLKTSKSFSLLKQQQQQPDNDDANDDDNYDNEYDDNKNSSSSSSNSRDPVKITIANNNNNSKNITNNCFFLTTDQCDTSNSTNRHNSTSSTASSLARSRLKASVSHSSLLSNSANSLQQQQPQQQQQQQQQQRPNEQHSMKNVSRTSTMSSSSLAGSGSGGGGGHSLVSDYRLCLTDLIELNLIDAHTGLIINPLNGKRLSIADAIRIDWLDTDVKEIANTSTTAAQANKLTVREAIHLGTLNANTNELYISNNNNNNNKSSNSSASTSSISNSLNLYEAARQRSLILKPLTLAEAFMRNLIQPNGFVRNPLNNKYYAFESLVNDDMAAAAAAAASLKSQDTQTLSQQPIYMFDFETKHIIDPVDNESRKLLSLADAVRIGLILPRTFQLNLAYNDHYARVDDIDNDNSNLYSTYDDEDNNDNDDDHLLNLYEAFYAVHNADDNNTKRTKNIGLVVYKPEIENAYVKLMSSSLMTRTTTTSQCTHDNHLTTTAAAMVLAATRRDRIGLIEALNCQLIDLKRRVYRCVSSVGDAATRSANVRELSLSEAARSPHKLVDPLLVDLLDTPIHSHSHSQHSGSDKTLTICDCINNSSLQLERFLYRPPAAAHAAASTTRGGEYMRLDSHSCRVLLGEHVYQRIRRLVTRITVKTYVISLSSHQQQQQHQHSSSIKLPFSFPPRFTSRQQQAPKVPTPPPPASTTNVARHPIAIAHVSSVQLRNQQQHRSSSNRNSSSSTSHYEQVATQNADDDGDEQLMELTIRPSKMAATVSSVSGSGPYLLDYVLDRASLFKADARTGGVTARGDAALSSSKSPRRYKLSVEEAKRRGILDVHHGLYVDKLSGKSIAIDDAIRLGLIGVRRSQSPPPPNSQQQQQKELKAQEANKKKSTAASTLSIELVLDQSNGQWCSVNEAIKRGLLDRTCLLYRDMSIIDASTAQFISLSDAYANGLVKGTCIQDTPEASNSNSNNNNTSSSSTGSSSSLDNVGHSSASSSSTSSSSSSSSSSATSCLSSAAQKMFTMATTTTTTTTTITAPPADEPQPTNNNNSNHVRLVYADRTLTESLEQCFEIVSVVDTRNGAANASPQLSLDEAIGAGLFDKERGLYVHPVSGVCMNLNEAVERRLVNVAATHQKQEPQPQPQENSTVLRIDVAPPPRTQHKYSNNATALIYQVNETNECSVISANSNSNKSHVASRPRIISRHQMYTPTTPSSSSSLSTELAVTTPPLHVVALQQQQQPMSSPIRASLTTAIGASCWSMSSSSSDLARQLSRSRAMLDNALATATTTTTTSTTAATSARNSRCNSSAALQLRRSESIFVDQVAATTSDETDEVEADVDIQLITTNGDHDDDDEDDDDKHTCAHIYERVRIVIPPNSGDDETVSETEVSSVLLLCCLLDKSPKRATEWRLSNSSFSSSSSSFFRFKLCDKLRDETRSKQQQQQQQQNEADAFSVVFTVVLDRLV